MCYNLASTLKIKRTNNIGDVLWNEKMMEELDTTINPLNELPAETRSLVEQVLQGEGEEQQDEVAEIAKKILDSVEKMKEVKGELSAKDTELQFLELEKFEILSKNPEANTDIIDSTIERKKNEIERLKALIKANKNLYKKLLQIAKTVYPQYFLKR